MSYIFISFFEKLERKSNFKGDFYNLSLEEQYQHLLKRIPENRRISSFREFIDKCFPTALDKRYYLSCPNFLREKRGGEDSSPSYLNNLVIRPEKTLSMREILPDNQNIILIGDLFEGQSLKKFVVKGIQLIDDNMISPSDLEISGYSACVSFSDRNWSIHNVDFKNTYFTPDNILHIIETCYTVDNPELMRKTYEQWKEYFDFRNYYLQEQSNRFFELNKCVCISSYAVNRKEFNMNSLAYREYILDGHDDFKKGDMIVLYEKVANAELFPLIRLDIIRNKKEFEAKSIKKGSKQINEEERKIRTLASDNVIITSTDPNIEKNLKKLIDNGYELGDRFRTIKFDIKPIEHIRQIENDAKQEIDIKENSIRNKYKIKIEKEAEQFIKFYKAEERKKIKEKCLKYQNELDSKLENDVKENNDKSILSKISLDVEKKIINIYKKDKNLKFDIKEKRKELYSEVDIKSYYNNRNRNSVDMLGINLEQELNSKLRNEHDEKVRELNNKYQQDIENEIRIAKSEIERKQKDEIKKAIDEETNICFSIYFKPNDKKELSVNVRSQISNCQYIAYDNRAERAKLRRQEDALYNFYSGNVKNPYLSRYLFTPEKLQPVIADHNDWIWYLESLNEKQKEAVRKAVSSNGVFLLQGPPGTGKTQVIAEIVAHLVQEGKKVIISSETHKAIDNVFDRLPRIADIIPVRLIPSKNNKTCEYTPKYLVDNFYRNISDNMTKKVRNFNNFQKNKEDFYNNFKTLKILYSKINKAKSIYESLINERNKFNTQITEKNKKINELYDRKDNLTIEYDILKRTSRHIEKFNISINEDIKEDIIAGFRDRISKLFDSDEYVNIDLSKLLELINSVKIQDIESEIAKFDENSQELIINAKISELKAKMNDILENNDFDINTPEYIEYRQEFIKLKKQNNVCENLIISQIFNHEFLKTHINSITTILEDKKNSLKMLKNEFLSLVNDKLIDNEDKKNILQDEIDAINNDIKLIQIKINEIEESNENKEIQKNKRDLDLKINDFFRDFNILEPYKTVSEALDIIENTFNDLQKNYTQREIENKEKIPMYEKISDYLLNQDVIDNDRKTYTKDLFENANVFGITCTSNDKFSKANNSELGDFGIDDIDLKSIGIDVVIIDEVSKSSFVDLLIPILYGKTVILVGDHRQLPPMYEFSKMRAEEFENLDKEIINPEKNMKFTQLYEECFFKTLFEKIPDAYKTMLVQQYRCHEHIMKVFNHFYQGELRLGFDGQNNEKRHYIDLDFNGRKIIQQDKHIYFVDCKEPETKDVDSTSIYNMGEAKVAVELLKKFKYYFHNNQNIPPLSVGVICTYGDQAKKIKSLMKNEKIRLDDFSSNSEKLIISTVDDFQGDERDIIILSLVRNPENPSKSKADFIRAYQRINVALSRARKLLIVIGNRKYVEREGVIDLPDVYGRKEFDKKHFRVYEEIINTIETYGRVLEDIDIIDYKGERTNE